MFKTLIWTLTWAAILTSFLTSCGSEATSPLTTVPLYQGNPDYAELTEPESPWYGTLKDTGGGYTLAFGDQEQALYTEGVETQLAPFVGQKVVITGKLASKEGNSPLWPAKVELHEDGLLACSTQIPPKPAEEKIHSSIATLIVEQPGEQVEGVSISFCDDQAVTPESTMEQLERLRASAYAMLKQELAPLVVEVEETSWLSPSLNASVELRHIAEIAKRADTLSIDSSTLTTPPPAATLRK